MFSNDEILSRWGELVESIPGGQEVVQTAFNTAGIAGGILILLMFMGFSLAFWYLKHVVKPREDQQNASIKLRDEHLEKQTVLLSTMVVSITDLHTKFDRQELARARRG